MRPKFSLVQLSESQPLGHFEAERDSEMGYPSSWTTEPYPNKEQENTRDYVHQFIDSSSGRLKTEWEVENEKEAKAD